jgi:hypothetical protein
MKTGLPHLDATIQVKSLPANAPTFMVLPQDMLAGPTARAWAAMAYAEGVSPAVVESALQQADALDAWPDKKLPDGSHLTPAQIRQLTYELGRRARDAAPDSADPRIMLAEERAIIDALGRVRPLLARMFERMEWQDDGSIVYQPLRDKDGRAIPDPHCPITGLQRLEAVLRAGEPAEEELSPLVKAHGRPQP